MWKALAKASVGLLATMPIDATPSGRFPYKFEMTPKEGQADPAVEKRYSAAFDTCQKRAVTTFANSECFTDEFARQDATLNRTWRATLVGLDSKMRSELLAAQRRWVADRDPFCRAKAAEFGGRTIAPVIYANCRVDQTIRRTIWLEELFPPVPPTMQGVWGRHGRCDLRLERLTITAHTAGWGRGPFQRVDYNEGDGSVGWVEEGVVDNFVIGGTPDTLVHNTQGFHMPGQDGYLRCGHDLKRLPWPRR